MQMAGIKTLILCNKNIPLNCHLPSLSHEHRFGLVCSSSAMSGKMKVIRVRKRGKRISPAMLALNEGEVVSGNESSTMKLSALVTLRSGNDNKVFVHQMVNNLLTIFGPRQQKQGVVLQLVSAQLDPKKMEAKLSKETTLELSEEHKGRSSIYKVDFIVDSDFGVPAAITVVNGYDNEFFLETITIAQTIHFACKSWVQPSKLHPHKRFFFVNKAYLPSETPIGVKEAREKELRQLRGDGKGRRVPCERIYDYDVYNDLGDPDKGEHHARPTLGGSCNPYPTRCRTGRPSTTTDTKAESRPSESELIYVPRDEELGDIKRETMDQGKLMAILQNIMPALTDKIIGNQGVFNIDHFIKDSSQLPPLSWNLFNFGSAIQEIFKFDPPKVFSRDKSHFLQDDELGRQVLSAFPLSIERLKVFPPESKLDPSKYGSVESALKEEHIIDHLEGMSIKQALEENKLFVQDYHDVYLPFLHGINALEERKAYATTTIFFLTKMGTLKPIAIELALPTENPNASSKQVLTPPKDATSKWLWQLGKAHVCSNDAGVHTLVHHWLRIHACMEPLIIAAHRQLSVMHPIFKLLNPHMRYTLKTNAISRQTLINAEGTIETDHTPGRYCMQISSAVYKDWWRFDMEGLPADLIRRGLAVPDATQLHGIRLLIEDYPFAADGLLIWSSIEKLVQTYVNHYYKNSNDISTDNELQSWYREFINLGHPDHKNASWWPELAKPKNLISILTTVIWIVSAQHAVLNFGQYPCGGYVPIRPPLMRKLIPKEEDPEYTDFVMDPQRYFLSSLPSLFQASKFMAVIKIGSAHSPDEEYIGDIKDLSSWVGEPEIIDAFNEFSMDMKNIENEINRRNADPKLRNRCGVDVLPYELLIPSSGHGATGRGVPNSVTA